MKSPRISLVLLLLLPIFLARGSDLADWKVEGNAALDKTLTHSGTGASIKLPPGARITRTLRPDDASGRVTLWVYDDMTLPAQPKEFRSGPSWGVMQANGQALVVGCLYAPYLGGAEGYSSGEGTEAFFRKCQWLGVTRKTGWRKWDFVFDPDKGCSILVDDTPVAAFDWNKTAIAGFSGIVIFGDDANAPQGQTLWIDDVTAQTGGPMKIQPPPPPPPLSEKIPNDQVASPIPPGKWKNGPPTDPAYFPIAVWMQNTQSAARYKAAGINIYVAVSNKLDDSALADLQKAGVSLICGQGGFALEHRDSKVIVGWMHGDEPDNSQSIPNSKDYGPPIPPQTIVQEYDQIRSTDTTRPVMLNLGMGVAFDDWIGRGPRTHHPEDYAEYAKGGDLISFDIYPVVDTTPNVTGRLELVPKGVQRLIGWTNGEKPIWNCIECTHIGNASVKPTPAQVRAEVWMSLIHGSRGLIYFVHQFAPSFKEAALLDDPEMLTAVTAINQQIHDLAPVLNSPNVKDRAKVTTVPADAPIALMVKQGKDGLYVFAVNMRDSVAHGAIDLHGDEAKSEAAEVLGESRKIPCKGGKFVDDFKPWEVHIYEIK